MEGTTWETFLLSVQSHLQNQNNIRGQFFNLYLGFSMQVNLQLGVVLLKNYHSIYAPYISKYKMF
jgi:hypothetical protein